MKVAVTGDFHGFLPEITSCDLLLVVGDICPETHQQRWLRETFAPWLERAPARSIVGVAGNHDYVALEKALLMHTLPWTYLCDESAKVQGLTLHGSPWTDSWGAFSTDEKYLARLWTLIPQNTNILITHTPPRGRGDRIRGVEAIGSRSLRRRVDELPSLKLHAFGHIHEGYGSGSGDGARWWCNGSHVNEHYEPTNPPLYIDL